MSHIVETEEDDWIFIHLAVTTVDKKLRDLCLPVEISIMNRAHRKEIAARDGCTMSCQPVTHSSLKRDSDHRF
eukprot:gene10564-biopygen15639